MNFLRSSVMVVLWFGFFLYGNPNEEFRATWVITWDHISSSSTAEENKARIREIMDDHAEANMTSVLFQVRQSGTAYYNSSFEPWGYYTGYQNPGYDPLAYAVEQAHQRGLELHAWFNVFQTSSLRIDTLPSGDTVGSPAAMHPEWVCRDQNGNSMTSYRSISPGLEEVRSYTVNVAMEIVNNYDIDGLHLDYIRWNEYTSSTARPEDSGGQIEEIRMMDGNFTDSQYQALNRNQTGRYLYDYLHPYSDGVPGGFDSWEDWWTSSVTSFVQTLHDSIQSVKPYVRLSVAALGRYNWGVWQGLGDVYQDAALWFNEGYIEQLTPMHYHWTTGSSFYSMLEGSCPNCWREFIQEGLDSSRHFSVGPGSYILHDNNVWENHNEIVESVRNVDWVDGFQFFSSGTWDLYNYWNNAKTELFPGKSIIRSSPNPESSAPLPPEISITAMDTLTHSFQIVRSSTSSPSWIVLYRAEDSATNDSLPEIVDVFFSSADTISSIQLFSGLQDYNGQYVYKAAQTNRYWNASDFSNLVITDSVTSFAPTIILSNPVYGDTIPAHRNVIIQFSKNIIQNLIDGAISFAPDINFNISFDSDEKILTISFPQSLDFDTDYILRIDSTLTDVNGRMIDGNGDGIEGDTYYLSFRTESEDIYGPEIFQSNLEFATHTSGVDVDGPITIVFNEEIDQATISDGIILASINDVIPVEWNFVNLDNKSMVAFRASSPLDQTSDYYITIDDVLTDTLGNGFNPDTAFFTTQPYRYTDVTTIDNFSSTSNWWDPSGSGSTTGILAGSGFGTNTNVYLPRTSPQKSAQLTYVWDTSESYHLLREYLSGGPPRSVIFDTTVTLQCFIFGDNSQNFFRFCIDEKMSGTWSGHEVSKWITIDWYGWKLIEWKLNDPESVGNWIGNEILDGTDYRFDSFQLSYDQDNGDETGAVFFDDLRIVETTTELGIDFSGSETATSFSLEPNYPNPFNAITNIPFTVPNRGHYNLSIFDLRGRKVRTLFSKLMDEGNHSVQWNGLIDDDIPAPSGIYFYRISGTSGSAVRQMLLVK